MSQPDWKCVANLGDADPLAHGGLFVFVDKTGVYPPEMLQIEVTGGDEEDEYNDDGELTEEGDESWELRRVSLEPCTYIKGVLSDNEFHPSHPAWFADDLDSVASSMGMEKSELIRLFCSDEPCERADAWRAVFDHWGWDNGDAYPETEDTRRDLEPRVDKWLQEIKGGE